MGFFTDLKEDLNQAVSELMPDELSEEQNPADQPDAEGQDNAEPTQQQMANLEEMLQNIDELRIVEDEEETDPPAMGITAEEAVQAEETEDPETAGRADGFQKTADFGAEAADAGKDPESSDGGNLEQELRAAFGTSGNEETMEEYLYKQAMRVGSEIIDKSWVLDLKDMEATDENAVITAGMRVKGDILSNGNLDVTGEVIGNVQVSGKLSVTGRIRGNSKADEIYADSAKITGDLIGDGTVKIGAGSVVRGNIEASSAAIAGAVKGTIDVKGPVVLDATAVVFGNIRAKSMQINNGARIEGMCVLCYAEQSASKFFEAQENM